MKCKDIRTLCYRCASEMFHAGILLRRHGPGGKCDKCRSPKGSEWEVSSTKG